MKILVAPLNWGLGHASRCVPLVHRFLDEGHEVILGGDGESLTLLRKHFPKLRYVYLAPLNLRYSKGHRQVGAMLCALPKLLGWMIKDHAILRSVLREEHIDQIVSDNRFGLYLSNSPKDGLSVKRSISETVCQAKPVCIYLTHQLHIMLPKGWKWLEPLAARLHARIYTRYNKVWVPDYADPDKSLAGELSHLDNVQRDNVQCTIEYIGPLSRFSRSVQGASGTAKYEVVAVMSGLEPQRTMLEKELLARYQDATQTVLIVQGLMHRPNTRIQRGKITIVPHVDDAELATALKGAKHIIARSGYSTIMDLNALGLLSVGETGGSKEGPLIELIPTPGQPEQEYLSARFLEKNAENC